VPILYHVRVVSALESPQMLWVGGKITYPWDGTCPSCHVVRPRSARRTIMPERWSAASGTPKAARLSAGSNRQLSQSSFWDTAFPKERPEGDTEMQFEFLLVTTRWRLLYARIRFAVRLSALRALLNAASRTLAVLQFCEAAEEFFKKLCHRM